MGRLGQTGYYRSRTISLKHRSSPANSGNPTPSLRLPCRLPSHGPDCGDKYFWKYGLTRPQTAKRELTESTRRSSEPTQFPTPCSRSPTLKQHANLVGLNRTESTKLDTDSNHRRWFHSVVADSGVARHPTQDHCLVRLASYSNSLAGTAIRRRRIMLGKYSKKSRTLVTFPAKNWAPHISLNCSA